MIIAIGTTNKVKIEAVTEIIQNYPLLSGAKLESFSAPSNVSEQPFSIDEMIQGAKNRTKNAFDSCQSCNYSFGIESGLFKAEGTQNGYIESCICSIYDGEEHHIGLSCGLEIPPAIFAIMKEKNIDLGKACYESGITTNSKLGASEGLIGLLTNGRIDRKEYTKQCITTALIQLEYADWYHKTLVH